jgi:hypothetical protein
MYKKIKDYKLEKIQGGVRLFKSDVLLEKETEHIYPYCWTALFNPEELNFFKNKNIKFRMINKDGWTRLIISGKEKFIERKIKTGRGKKEIQMVNFFDVVQTLKKMKNFEGVIICTF